MKNDQTNDKIIKKAYQTLRARQKDLRCKFKFQKDRYIKPELQTQIQIFTVPAGSYLYKIGPDEYATLVDGIQYKELQLIYDNDYDQWKVFNKVDSLADRKYVYIDKDDIKKLEVEKPTDEFVKAYNELLEKQKNLRQEFLKCMIDMLKPVIETQIKILNVPAKTKLYNVGPSIFAAFIDSKYKELEIEYDTDCDQWVVYKKVNDMRDRKFLFIDDNNIKILDYREKKTVQTNNSNTDFDKDGFTF